MSNKKIIGISVAAVVFLILIVSGFTYAYFMAVTEEGVLNSGSGKLDINYVGPSADSLTGNIISSDSRDSGIKATATASLNTGSEDALFNMHITPTAITGLNIAAFKWEVEGIRDGSVVAVCSGSGNFNGATVNNKITMVSNCPLTTDIITFNIYIWLDGNLITDAISNATFGAKIEVDSVPITGQFE